MTPFGLAWRTPMLCSRGAATSAKRVPDEDQYQCINAAPPNNSTAHDTARRSKNSGVKADGCFIILFCLLLSLSFVSPIKMIIHPPSFTERNHRPALHH